MKNQPKLSVVKKSFRFIMGVAVGILLWGLTLLVLLILN
tara:strand:+ start:1146 stop:1262 length:117 start_codon:yes stop_codon:yes gene_type:complete